MGRVGNKIHRNRTYVKFGFSFLVTLCLPIMCFTYIFLQNYREVYRSKIIEQAENALDTTGMEMDRYIGSLWMTIFNDNLNIDMEKAVLNEEDYYATEVSNRLRDSLATHYILSNVCYYSKARPDKVYTVSGVYALPYYEKIYMGAAGGERLPNQLQNLGKAGWMVWKQGTSLQYAIEAGDKGYWIFTISNEDLVHILSGQDSHTVLESPGGEELFAIGCPEMERYYEMAFDSPNGYFRLVRYMDEHSLFAELNALQRYFYLASVVLLLIGGILILVLTYYNGYPFRKLLEYSKQKVADIPEGMEGLEAFQFVLTSMEEQIAQAESMLRENQDAIQTLLDIREQYEAYIRCIREEYGGRSGNEKKESKEQAKKDDLVMEIAAYIDENRKSSDLCASMVADYFNMSISNMSHRFKKQMGRTVSDYITEKKFGFGGESSLPPIAVQCSLGSFHEGFFLDEDDGLFLHYGDVESVYPYRYQDMYDRALEPVQYDAVVLENDNLKATFLPAFGGKLWSLIDKRRDRELLFTNDVVRPCNLAVRNAWLSGGIEWNAGFRGHHPYTCSLLHTAQTRLEDGTPVLRFYYFERMRCAVVQMDFFLPQGSELLYARIRITNPNDHVAPMYWWSNAAVAEKDGDRVIVPALQSYTADVDEDWKAKIVKIHIPLQGGRDISYPAGNPSSKDYFWTLERDARRYICQLDAEGYGLCQTSTSRLKGRKLFVWGNSQGGHRWMNFLTADDKEGRYDEIQSGLACTQYECLPMPPHTVWEWLEGYGALQVQKEKAHGGWKEAREAVEEGLDRLTTEGQMESLLEETRAMARTAAPEKLFSMEGWGALEAYRRGKMGGSMMNDHLDFGQMGPQQLDWKRLLDEGTMGEHAPDEIPPSYQRQKEWLTLLEHALEGRDKGNWYTHYLYGTAMIAEKDYEKAFAHLRTSLELENTPWANYAMAVCYKKTGHWEKERESMLAAYGLRREDISLAKELFGCLYEGGGSEQTVELYESGTAAVRQNARCRLYYAYALARLGRAKEAEDILCGQGVLVVPDVREGELTVTQLWYEIQRQKGTGGMGQKIPRDLDFRMSGSPDERA